MKKNSVLRRIIPFVLMIAMMFTFACDKDSGGTENDTGNVQAAKTSGTVPRADAMTLINSISSGEKMYKFSYIDPDPSFDGFRGDRAGLFRETYDRRMIIEYEEDYYYYEPETEGFTHFSFNRYTDDQYTYSVGGVFLETPDGGHLVRGWKFITDEFNKQLEGEITHDDLTLDETVMVHISRDSEVIASYPCPDELPLGMDFRTQYLSDADGYQYIFDTAGEDKILVFSPEAEYLFSLDEPEDNLNPLFLMRDNDGNVGYVYMLLDDSKTSDGFFCLRTIDIENQCWSDIEDCKKIPVLATHINGEGVKKLMFGGGLDYYYVDKYGIIGRNEGDTKTDLLLNWLDVGLSYDEIAAISIYSPELIFLALYNPGGEGYKYGKIELVTTESVYGKGGKPTPLKIAVDKANNPSAAVILDYAASFIRSDYGCPVEIVDYTDEGTRTANQVLLRDISSGNGPDMVVFGGGLSYEVLNKSGAFVDLYKLGGKDTDDLLPCVRKPFENDKGELNRLIFSFAIANVAGSKGNVKSPMTVDDLIKLNSSLGNGQYLTYVTDLTDTSKQADMLFEKLIPNTLNQYVDYDNNTIDTNGLGELMKLCKDAKVYGVEWIFVDPNLFRDGTIALDISEVYDPAQLLINRYLNFSKEDLEYIGYPGIGTASVRPYNSLAILSSSKNQKMAWELLSHMLDCQAERYSTCEEQDLVKGSNAFPATYSGINALFDRLSMMQFLFDGGYSKSSNGKEYYGININAFELSEEEPMKTDCIAYSDDDKAALLDILENAKVCYTTDAESISIIEEEASYYFSGTKNLDEVLKLIKNRVETRLAE